MLLIMRLSDKLIRQLQQILNDENKVTLDDEQAQLAGLAIVRLIVAKHRRQIKKQGKRPKDG